MAGYTYQYAPLHTLNEYIAYFDSSYAETGDRLKPLHSVNGLNLAFRRDLLSNVALEIGYETALSYKRSEYTKFNPEDSPQDVRLNSQWNSFFAGLEFHNETMGLGGIFNYDQTRIKFKNETLNDSKTVVKQNGFGTTLFASLYLSGSGNTSLIFRPYYRIYFDPLDLTKLAEVIDPHNNLDISKSQQISAFGLKLIFKNQGN